jgi:hypothetical protein
MLVQDHGVDTHSTANFWQLCKEVKERNVFKSCFCYNLISELFVSAMKHVGPTRQDADKAHDMNRTKTKTKRQYKARKDGTRKTKPGQGKARRD